jgi:nucleoside-diphosphate-sugar epimerase
MKILIVGNLGYIGPMVVEHLEAALDDVKLYGFDIGFFQANVTSSTGMLPESLLTCQYYGDVRKFDYTLLDGMDTVVYLAAISNDPMGKHFEKPTHEINDECAVKMAKECRARGVRSFVFASSCSVYGLADTNPKNESSEINPLTAYARSKTNCEKGLRSLASKGFSITCLRFATACGFSYRLRLDLVLNDFVASAITSGKIEILSDGQPWRPLINVKDMARAIEWAVQRNTEPDYLVVNAGADDWNYQVVDLAHAVKKALPQTQIHINPNAQPDNRSYKVDFSLFNQLAKGYTPRCTLEQTIKELVDGLSSINFRNPDFRNSNLMRLKSLTDLIDSGKLTTQLTLGGGKLAVAQK